MKLITNRKKRLLQKITIEFDREEIQVLRGLAPNIRTDNTYRISEVIGGGHANLNTLCIILDEFDAVCSMEELT